MFLIVEGESDYRVMKHILKHKGIDVHVEKRMPSGGGGIPQLARELKTLLKTSM